MNIDQEITEILSMPDQWKLDGRIAFVTGAGGAIGRAICTALAEAGAHVHCADLRLEAAREIGRASCRERVSRYV